MAGIGGFAPSDDWADWLNRTVVNRGTVAPIAQDAETGAVQLAWPGMFYEPLQSLKRVIASGGRTDTTYDDAGVPVSGKGTLQPLDGLNVAGIAPLGTAMATIGARRAVPVIASHTPRFADELSLEAVEAGSRFGEKAKSSAGQSKNWPSGWDLSTPEKLRDAELFTRFADAEDAWRGVVDRIQFQNGRRAMERWEAEKIAMDNYSDLGFQWQDAKLAFKEGRAGRPLTPAERAWDDLDRPPGSPPLSDEEMMRRIVVPNIIMPDGSMPGAAAEQFNALPGVSRKLLSANPDTAAPLAISGQGTGQQIERKTSMFDFLKNFANTQLANPTAFAPKGEGGWQTAVQNPGSPLTWNPDGSFAGANITGGDIGRGLQAASQMMPGASGAAGAVGAFAQPTQSAAPAVPHTLSATPSTNPRRPSWVESLLNR